MDRNNNWDRTATTYAMLTQPEFKTRATSWHAALERYYAQGITDEFIPSTHLDSDSTIMPGDGIIFCNIRADRARQLTQLLLKSNAAWIITGIPYGQGLTTTALYTPPILYDTLLDTLSAAGKTIFTCAESEKYAHITYFFKGGKEELLPNETRIIIPSHNPTTFKEHPEMCAPEITQTVVQSLQTNPCDFYVVNYANPDMVGHSGDFDATVKALECIDAQLGKLYTEIVEKRNGTLYITSDHGKAEQLWDPAHNQPCTAHTTNPVPFIMIRKDLLDKRLPRELHTLADIAPLVLQELKIT
jgi:2,3-bisphosphoglycerate-independent phosphoglycerate mutase